MSSFAASSLLCLSTNVLLDLHYKRFSRMYQYICHYLRYRSLSDLIHVACTDIGCNTENGPIHQPPDTDGLADEILRVVGLLEPRAGNRCWEYGLEYYVS